MFDQERLSRSTTALPGLHPASKSVLPPAPPTCVLAQALPFEAVAVYGAGSEEARCQAEHG